MKIYTKVIENVISQYHEIEISVDLKVVEYCSVITQL